MPVPARDLAADVEEALFRERLPAGALKLEITESVLMERPEAAAESLGRLMALGARVLIDDFGTGYSSLAVLRRLPAEAIKIDRSFVQGTEDGRGRELMRLMVDMAHALGMGVVVEGVEDEDAARRLAAMGCDMLQGHYYGPAMEEEAAFGMLAGTGRGRRSGEWRLGDGGREWERPRRPKGFALWNPVTAAVCFFWSRAPGRGAFFCGGQPPKKDACAFFYSPQEPQHPVQGRDRMRRPPKKTLASFSILPRSRNIPSKAVIGCGAPKKDACVFFYSPQEPQHPVQGRDRMRRPPKKTLASFSILPKSRSIPSRAVIGCGGQPGMYKSTGKSASTPSWDSGIPANGPPEMAQDPEAITIRGSGVASWHFRSARRMFSVTGPVTMIPSAWRGEATNSMPKRPRSKKMVVKTFKSASQALQPPALTCRSFRDRPKQPPGPLLQGLGQPQGLAPVVQMLAFAHGQPVVAAEGQGPGGRAAMQSVQNRHLPRSMAGVPFRAQARQDGPHGAGRGAGRVLAAVGRAFRGVDDRQAPETVGQGRGLAGKATVPALLAQAFQDGAKHCSGSLSRPGPPTGGTVAR
jgi:hypothetical protein